MGGAVNWRGVSLDARTAEMMNEVVRLCPGIVIDPTQGSWSGASASAGTHSGAGALDIAAANLAQAERDQIVYMGRMVGMAIWHRDPSQGSWPHHIHGVSVGEPGLSAAAADQVADYFAGRNGLANNAPDDGPRDFVGVTWEEYQLGGVLMAKAVVFFQTDNGKIWEADILAGSYYWVRTEEDLKDRKAVLDTLGIPWTNWTPGQDVANREAFGVEVAS